MAKENLALGRSGEKLAGQLLEGLGYRMLECNYKTAFGEIDIIAKDGDTLCFVEVKTRHSNRCGKPCESVNIAKQRRIAKAALYYLKTRRLFDRKARFDVVSIEWKSAAPRLDLIKNAFELDERYTY